MGQKDCTVRHCLLDSLSELLVLKWAQTFFWTCSQSVETLQSPSTRKENTVSMHMWQCAVSGNHVSWWLSQKLLPASVKSVTKRRCFPCVHWIFIAMQKACCTYSTTICASVHVSVMLIAFTVPSLVVTSIVQTSHGTRLMACWPISVLVLASDSLNPKTKFILSDLYINYIFSKISTVLMCHKWLQPHM